MYKIYKSCNMYSNYDESILLGTIEQDKEGHKLVCSHANKEVREQFNNVIDGFQYCLPKDGNLIKISIDHNPELFITALEASSNQYLYIADIEEFQEKN